MSFQEGKLLVFTIQYLSSKHRAFSARWNFKISLSLFAPQVKFLKTKEGCAMIQMGDSIAVERCLQNLNNVTIGMDGRLQLGFSKQAFLSDVTNPYILPDKTASFKDFTGSKNNR